MGSVTGQVRLVRPRRSALRPVTLLVLALLTGLLGMHALAPAGSPMADRRMAAAPAHSAAAASGSASVPVSAMSSSHDDCGEDAGGCDRHSHHADATCTSASVGGTPVLPAPAPAPACLAGEGPELQPSAPDTPEGGRAPPSLAELQLLRI